MSVTMTSCAMGILGFSYSIIIQKLFCIIVSLAQNTHLKMATFHCYSVAKKGLFNEVCLLGNICINPNSLSIVTEQ